MFKLHLTDAVLMVSDDEARKLLVQLGEASSLTPKPVKPAWQRADDDIPF
jgi:hypothetical protein